MLLRLKILVLLICCGYAVSCSPETEEPDAGSSISRKVDTLKPRNAEVKPEPVPQLVILFEFEGIPQSSLNSWIGNRNLKLVQHQLKLSEQGLPVKEADLYILSPRLITQFIEKNTVARWDPAPDLSAVNPIFTSHSFDFKNEYAVPWRWTPMVLLQHLQVLATDPTTSVTTPAVPIFPEDPVMIASLQSSSVALEPVAPTVPDPGAYRIAWESFLASRAATVWIPAACPIRNTSDYINPGWKWSLPQARTTIIFDHLLLGARSKLKQEALELVNYLVSSQEQDLLITNSGYLPVVCPLGQETQTSPIPMPKGSWLNNSNFISLPAYSPAPADESAAPGNDPDTGSERVAPKASDAPALPSSPGPGTTPPDQTVY